VLAGEGEHKAKMPDRIHDPELQALDELLHAQAEPTTSGHSRARRPTVASYSKALRERLLLICAEAQ